ncbi:MAG: NADH:flavin oxidoreductase [Deltaproteobacteria bacterium]|jgi:2,4-dienoyl-CoA reductase-like NADH-dependent reductase (Old Yellow Enzyme family)|nr:NADH:flavin oxidoreductase [Deltaproteobacteria bacterium]
MDALFEKSSINGMVLSNRFVRSATWAGMATDEGACTPQLIRLLTDLAAGEVGLIITGHAYVRQDGQHSPWQLGIHRDAVIPAFRDLTHAVHEHGSKIVVQLGYGGAYLSKSRVRSMSAEDFEALAQAYGQAAVRARRAGFDGVQIFAAHGFFLSQLLCPRYNDRTDDYGGNIVNRARGLIEVLEAIRNAVGMDYPVLAKLNCRDFVENGLNLKDSVQVASMLEKAGIDAIEISGGLLNNPNIMHSKINADGNQAYFQSEARVFKETIHVPLILVGGIRSYDTAKQLVDEGYAEYISMSRPFIREPGLIKRWRTGDRREAACISCDNCFEPIKKGEGVSCIPSELQEAQKFFPQLSEIVPASPPHPPGTGYKISIGLEDWESNYIPIVKIQMIYNERTLERGLSFPLGTQDHQKVSRTIADLLEKHANSNEQ